jgi:purine-nucleoside phosphorylase
MSNEYPTAPNFVQQLHESHDYISSRLKINPKIAIILGSGLGEFAESLSEKVILSAVDIPHYPGSTVAGHQGKLVFGFQEDVPLMAVQGRTHYYEGLPFFKVTWTVRLMAEMGISILIVTNAAGGINPSYLPGDLMLIRDHINLMFGNPLIGSPDVMSSTSDVRTNMYDDELCHLMENSAEVLSIPLRNGVLLATSGPSYETVSEIKMAGKFGADAVSMSTIPEVIMANFLGIRTVGISLITNMATGISVAILNHTDVTSMANRNKLKFQKLVSEAIKQISKKSIG